MFPRIPSQVYYIAFHSTTCTRLQELNTKDVCGYIRVVAVQSNLSKGKLLSILQKFLLVNIGTLDMRISPGLFHTYMYTVGCCLREIMPFHENLCHYISSRGLSSHNLIMLPCILLEIQCFKYSLIIAQIQKRVCQRAVKRSWLARWQHSHRHHVFLYSVYEEVVTLMKVKCTRTTHDSFGTAACDCSVEVAALK